MNMNELLESLYQNDSAGSSLEKTAESTLMESLRTEESKQNPFMEMDLDTLIKIASDIDNEEEVNASSEELDKTAMDMLGGKLMAHAMIHEFGLMKEAMVNGNCRVCKTNHMDVEGSTVCSACLSAE